MFDPLGWIARLTDKAKLLLAGLLLVLCLACLIVTLIGWGAARGDAKAERERADTAELNLGRCEVDRDRLRVQTDEQNNRIRIMGEESARATAALERDLKAARAGRAASDAKLRRLSQPLTAPTVCERYEEADQALLETLQ